jgi:hydroxymethylglutaryl-CoA reductase (NADPH)
MSDQFTTQIPSRIVGPFHFKALNGLSFKEVNQSIKVPLATYETTLFPSVSRGAKLSRLTENLTSTLLSDGMTRSLMIESSSVEESLNVVRYLKNNIPTIQKDIVSKHSKHAQLLKVDEALVGTLLYLRFYFSTGNASGHNMSTFAVDQISEHLLALFPAVKYLSLSGNYCTDKKVSAVNRILGRGKHVISEITISREMVETHLKSTPEAMVDLHIKKNLIGSIISGGLLTGNAHYANMLLATYLATGQDAANIVEGSQGITHLEVKNDQLYMSVNIPNIIVGTVGHGKEAFQSHFEMMGCTGPEGSEKLALIFGGVVLAGELSLLAALTNQHELVKSHQAFERR